MCPGAARQTRSHRVGQQRRRQRKRNKKRRQQRRRWRDASGSDRKRLVQKRARTAATKSRVMTMTATTATTTTTTTTAAAAVLVPADRGSPVRLSSLTAAAPNRHGQSSRSGGHPQRSAADATRWQDQAHKHNLIQYTPARLQHQGHLRLHRLRHRHRRHCRHNHNRYSHNHSRSHHCRRGRRVDATMACKTAIAGICALRRQGKEKEG